jgi:hypothetical protein
MKRAKPRMLVTIKFPRRGNVRCVLKRAVLEASVQFEQWLASKILDRLPLEQKEGEFSVSFVVTHKPGKPFG